MELYQTTKISPYFTIQVDVHAGEFELSDQDKKGIEAIWQREIELRGGNLFNGKMLSFIALEQERLLGKFVDYKHYIAQLIEPSLKQILEIVPVTISCITICEDHLLVGKRSNIVTEHKGCYECVPSGGINWSSIVEDHVDLSNQVRQELEEETGLSVTYIQSMTPFALVHDHRKEMYEICVLLQLRRDAREAITSFNLEYSTLEWIPKKDLKKWMSTKKEKFVPFSLYLIDNYGG